MIAWTFLTALIGSALLFLLPARRAGLARRVALAAALAGCLPVAVAVWSFDFGAGAGAAGFQLEVQREWIPALGITFHLGVDGISLVLIVLTALVAVAGILFSWNVERAPRHFFALYLLIIAGAYGVFLSLDLFLFLVFYEIVIVPKYFLIAGWGSTNRSYAAMKLTLYSIVGSALVIIGILAARVASGLDTFGLLELAAASFAPGLQLWAFPVLFLGFAILAGIWPFHTWVPGGHVAAPTAASMLLAGVVMKLGAYGALRIAMPLFPEGLEAWRLIFASMAAVGIAWGAGAALAQRDLKFVIAYSSISHMGFVLLGILSLTSLGVAGGVLQMVSHGVIASLLFAVAGRMLHDRVHTRELAVLAGLGLRRALPFAAFVFVLASAASMGLPGFSGFIAEVLVLVGTWGAFPLLLLPAGIGVLLTVAFTLKALQQAFFSRAAGGRESADAGAQYEPISLPEIIGAVLLLAAALGIGLYPQPWIAPILEAMNSDLMRVLLP
ncbi:MAG: NADH-quinone oxidoreductase subunit M [Puniceicoccaceae bacterium]|nr:MAG: NADH-quinone oxidoreductase subunit M [Puniceicoccaceae bacterium]